MSKPTPLEFGATYHIYNRGNNGVNLFHETRNYAYFLKLYTKHIAPIAETYAYCLLRNHFHLLVRIREKDNQNLTGLQDLSGLSSTILNPSQQFSNFFNAYTKSINSAYGRTGNLFQRPFGRIQVMTDDYFAQLIHYIHFNPQKHGLVPNFREYLYSSYDALCSDKPTRLARDEVLDRVAGKRGFDLLHRSAIDEKRIAQFIGDDD